MPTSTTEIFWNMAQTPIYLGSLDGISVDIAKTGLSTVHAVMTKETRTLLRSLFAPMMANGPIHTLHLDALTVVIVVSDRAKPGAIWFYGDIYEDSVPVAKLEDFSTQRQDYP